MMYKKTLLILFLFFTAVFSFGQNAKKYTTHVVKAGETLKSIAREADCKVKEIKNLNPDISKNPRVNTTLVIPNKNFGKIIITKNPIKPKEKVVVHLIEAGHTFYSIAKKYNVTIQSIKDANPAIADGLKVGQKIRIPSKSEFTLQAESGKVVFYKVKKGDTKWHIATVHKISVAELDKINPELQGELKENDNIWVPAPETVSEEVNATFNQEKDSTFIYHVVKQAEGLFRIAVIYDTTQDEIIKLNPEATKKLRPGMLLKIPGKKKSKFLIHTVRKGDTFYNLTRTYNVKKDSLLALNPALEAGLKLGMILKIKEMPNYLPNRMIDSLGLDKTIHISFLMPLMSDKNNTQSSFKNMQLQDICTDFYMGAQIALDSLAKQGLQVSHHIYDTNNDPVHLYNLLKDETIQASDAIIGPFFFDNAQKVAKELKNIPIITPLFSKNQVLDSKNNLIKAAVDTKELTATLLEYLMANYTHQKIILISDTIPTHKKEMRLIGNTFKQHDSLVNLQYLSPTHNKKKSEDIYMNKKALEESVTKGKEVWVIMVSTNTVIISDIINTYGVMANDATIRIFTTKELDNFDYINYQYLAQLNWTFPAVQFNKLNTASTTKFKETYQSLNYTQPSSYSYKGFDLTYDTLQRLSYDEAFVIGLEAGVSTRLAQQFNYVKSPRGDYRNQAIMLINFDKDMNFKVLN